MAFTHMGVQVHELEDYVKHVDPLPFAKEIVSYPTPQENDLKFPNPDSTEVQQRKVFEYVPEYLPYMHPELNGTLKNVFFSFCKSVFTNISWTNQVA
jgi:transcription initiation factor TFIID subunit 3